jgi:hypothetical protein
VGLPHLLKGKSALATAYTIMGGKAQR